MNPLEASAFLESLQPNAMHLQLEPVYHAATFFRHPERQFPKVHLCGTNGKGSTAVFLHEILKRSGYRVGLHTSPHLESFHERIQINGQPLSESEATALIAQLRRHLPGGRMLSYFEFLFLMAMLHFRDQKVDLAVIETGLGGRLDATNIILPEVTIITPISFDHMKYLGDSLEKIAREKCGTIKERVPVVTALQAPQVMRIIEATCRRQNAPLVVADPKSVTFPLGLAGEHQKQNAACAVEAAKILARSGFAVRQIESSLAAVCFPGRLETISSTPHIILDGAHNRAGADVLAAYLRKHFHRDKLTLMLGILADKEVEVMVEKLAPLAKRVVTVPVPSERSAPIARLVSASWDIAIPMTPYTSLEEGLIGELPQLTSHQTLVIAGSLYLVAAVRSWFQHHGISGNTTSSTSVECGASQLGG